MSDLDQMNPMEPEMEPQHDVPADTSAETHDQEGKMAKADLYKLATYSHKLFKQLHDDDQLEAWVQAKITKAADYVASVYHYLEYEMKFSEYGKHLDNAETLSEGQKAKLQAVLSEAKEKVKELKKSQAKKIEAKKVEENRLQAGEQECAACGGTGMVHKPAMTIHPDKQHLVDKHRTFRNAVKAIAGGDEVLTDEDYETSKGGKVTVNKDKTGKRTGVTHIGKPEWQADDAEYEEPKKEKAKGLSAAEKAPAKAADKAEKKKGKDWSKRFGKDSVTKVSAGKKVDPDAPKEKDEEEVDEAYGQGVYEAKSKCCCEEKGKAKCPVHGKVEESKPSAGLSKAKKSAVVKKAKAGGDIGKPGKNFEKTAKAAGGGEKGKKIAAAAMWKNIKETTAYIAEKAKAVKDLPGDQEKIDADHDGKIEKSDLAALRAGKKETVKESADTTRIRQLMQRLNG